MSENIEAMIDALAQDDMTGAGDAFQAALSDKMTTALDQERINVANTIFNDSVEEEEDFDDDLSDEDLEEIEEEEWEDDETEE